MQISQPFFNLQSGHKYMKEIVILFNAISTVLTLVLLNPDIPCLCKKCRSRSVSLKKPIDLDLHCSPVAVQFSDF